VLGHQLVRLDDLGLRLATLCAQSLGGAPELLRDAREGFERRVDAVGVFVRDGLGEGEGRPDRDPDADGEAGENHLGHGRSVTACSSARRMIAVEVAPGSWWPMLRSPRYDARPLAACNGTVACIPCSAAPRAAAIASDAGEPPSTCSRSTRTAGSSASTIVLSPGRAAPSSTTPASAASRASASAALS